VNQLLSPDITATPSPAEFVIEPHDQLYGGIIDRPEARFGPAETAARATSPSVR